MDLFEVIIMGTAAGVIAFGFCGMFYTASKEAKEK